MMWVLVANGQIFRIFVMNAVETGCPCSMHGMVSMTFIKFIKAFDFIVQKECKWVVEGPLHAFRQKVKHLQFGLGMTLT